jgi:hypothetical protein
MYKLDLTGSLVATDRIFVDSDAATTAWYKTLNQSWENQGMTFES